MKAAVIIYSDGTNEAASVTRVRKQAKAWNAVENFCKPFDLEDAEKEYTDFAFLIVCDMLLTGFDAPIEQVMYIDKKIREHTLLQAIARVNRVKKGKVRGYVVDYIGLANHLTEALTLYAATEEQEELRDGLKNITSELPILEERYQRLLQHFKAAGVNRIAAFVEGELPDLQADAEVVHAAVKILKDEKLRADFEVYFKKFLLSLDVILPHPAANPFRVPAKRFGYILRVTKERYKDDSLQLGDAGMTKEATTFYDYIMALSFPDGRVPAESKNAIKALMEEVVEQLQDSIGSIDFWHNPDKQKKMRSELKRCVLLSGVPELKQNRERIAVEIMKLAKNRHDELLKS